MAKLSTDARKHLPSKAFALPGRRYPIEDRAHAANAKARVAQHGTPEEKRIVDRKVAAKYPDMGKDSDGDSHADLKAAHPHPGHEHLHTKHVAHAHKGSFGDGEYKVHRRSED